jgi:diguanylate cyclase (GGDEF)-like protein
MGIGYAARLLQPAIARWGVRPAARLAVAGLTVCLTILAGIWVHSYRDTLDTVARAQDETARSSACSHVMSAFLAVDRARRNHQPVQSSTTPPPATSPPATATYDKSPSYRRARADLDQAIEQVRRNDSPRDRALASYLAIESRRFDQRNRAVDWDTLEVLVTAAADVHRDSANKAQSQLLQRQQNQSVIVSWLTAITAVFLAGCALALLLLQREVQQQADEQRHRAEHDDLTGLANRAGFLLHLRTAVARTGRGRGTVTVLLLDLDDFKPVNDRWGHQAGDDLLRAAAARIRDTVGPRAVAARLGGDEFGVLLLDLTEPEVNALVTQLDTALAQPHVIENHPVRVRASIGSATQPAGVASVDRLLRDADLAMYGTKNARKCPPPPTRGPLRPSGSEVHS